MSLLRLLSASQSLVGKMPPTSRYQMAQQHLLPKFNAQPAPVSGALATIVEGRAKKALPLPHSRQLPSAPPLTPLAAGLKAPPQLNPLPVRKKTRRRVSLDEGETGLKQEVV